ncbi:chromate resistance protein [Streptomyces sp. PSKA54]|uniref:Chromate resistance protein n=1 Tax=Streptomyces himalayensis subsp. aureolus TaxID=2758039 RepID=A0A7W2D3Z7_9ACTN|nr:Chromate resistance protein ChrB [Streptomyces himalayensis]MBA4864293.1 chromate resistance protein [Streptomyces himalayensis subsp. aureolus]
MTDHVHPAPSVDRPGLWVLLSYRLPREPSTPRITIWRKLKRLGVAQIGDGLIALPADARTREHLDWIAEEITDFGGAATVWIAQPASAEQERRVAQTMADARTAEYQQVLAQAEQARPLGEEERQRILRKLRAELRRIHRRDYFPPPNRRAAEAAVNALHPANDPTEESA